ncbi:MAG TPA: glycosyltransferase [Candidatus Polarisedimenticolia bacterium]|nr:glycosyltransferase [Candidatus Polarisedimenticolia bacterium]
MRVVHVNTEPTWRGGESQVFNLMRGLRGRGHTAEVVALPGGVLAGRCRADGFDVFELAMRSDADLPAAWRLARYLGKTRPDIVHAQTARAHSIALLARKLAAPGLLVVSRRLDFPIKPHLLNRWKYANRSVSAYIAVAEVIRDILVRAGVPPERVTVIQSSIDLARFTGVGDHRAAIRAQLGIPESARVVGNVAALAWHKGQQDLVAAMPAVLAAIPDAWLVIVGGGDQRDVLLAKARDRGVGGRVILTGARDDVPKVLTAFDLFCMPSYYEGLCNSVLEAFAMKVPVVATRAGGLPEIVLHEATGLLARPRDPADLAAALIRLLTEKELGRRVAEAGHDLVRTRFSAERMVERTETLYAGLLGGRAQT